MIDCIILSKDRPMQLECLLRSIKRHCNYLYPKVVYTYSEEYYLFGYKLIKGCEMILERGLKETILRNMNSEYICLMVDDNIVFKKAPEVPEIWKNQTFSLRIGDNVKEVHKNYPLSVDGHIYRKEDIMSLITNINFINPNKLESGLQKYKKDWELLYEYQCVIGVPHNRVSSTSHCDFSGDYPQEDLNRMFLSGLRIDFENMDFSNINNVHKEIPFKFKYDTSYKFI